MALPQRPKTTLFSKDRRLFMGGGLALLAGSSLALTARIAFGGDRDPMRAQDDLIWGVNGHPVTAYPGISLEDQFRLLQSLGFSHYRINLRGDGSPDQLDFILKKAKKFGVTILPMICPDTEMETESEADLKERAFALGEKMAKRFRARVRIWELANELENFAIIQPCEMRDNGSQYPCEWGPAGGVGALEYYGPRWRKVSAVLSGLSEGVAAGDPKALRAIGTAGFGHLGAFKRMVEDKIAWDITVWHDYETVRESYLEELASYGKPIWLTEFNAGGGGEHSLEENARMLTDRIAHYRAMRVKYDVSAAFVYELLDETYWGDVFEAKMGLVAIEKEADNDWKIGAIKAPGAAFRDAITSKR